jgi:uncharacterized protein
MTEMLETLLETARNDHRVLAVILYGSRARGDARPDSDTDICIVLSPEIDPKGTGVEVQLDYARFDPLDVRLFQRLPLYIRPRVLADGQILLVKNEDHPRLRGFPPLLPRLSRRGSACFRILNRLRRSSPDHQPGPRGASEISPGRAQRTPGTGDTATQ